jgi:hypothetical protein
MLAARGHPDSSAASNSRNRIPSASYNNRRPTIGSTIPRISFTAFDQCPRRMARAKCGFYMPKGSSRAQLLERQKTSYGCGRRFR